VGYGLLGPCYELYNPGLILGRDKTFFSFLKRPDWLWTPPSFIFNEYWGFSSLDLKRPRREVDHLYPVRRFRNTRSFS